ncbi:hypothetical protein [Blastococcus sp. SYSU DS0533]
MTSSATPTATWLPAALVRAAVVHPAAAPARGRHRAPEPSAPVPAGDGEQRASPARHADPEEQDSLAWLGTALPRG